MQNKLYICELCGKLTNKKGERVRYVDANLSFVETKNCGVSECLKSCFSAQGCNNDTGLKKFKKKHLIRKIKEL